MSEKNDLTVAADQVKIVRTDLCNYLTDNDQKKAGDTLSKAVDNILLVEKAISRNGAELSDGDKIKALVKVKDVLIREKLHFEELFSTPKSRVIVNTAADMKVRKIIDEMNEIAGVKSDKKI